MAYLKGQKTSSVDEVYEEFLVTIGPPWGPPRGAPRGKDLRFWWKKPGVCGWTVHHQAV